MLQERMVTFMSFCSKFIRVYICANNYFTVKRFDKVIAKNKTVQFFLPHGVNVVQHRPAILPRRSSVVNALKVGISYSLRIKQPYKMSAIHSLNITL